MVPSSGVVAMAPVVSHQRPQCDLSSIDRAMHAELISRIKSAWTQANDIRAFSYLGLSRGSGKI
jgi:hypothetical protein